MSESFSKSPKKSPREPGPLPYWEQGYIARSLQARSDIDTAKGIVMALRCCSTDAAFRELARVAASNMASVSTVASALVDLASANPQRPLDDGAGPAHAAAQLAWGGQLRRLQQLCR